MSERNSSSLEAESAEGLAKKPYELISIVHNVRLGIHRKQAWAFYRGRIGHVKVGAEAYSICALGASLRSLRQCERGLPPVIMKINAELSSEIKMVLPILLVILLGVITEGQATTVSGIVQTTSSMSTKFTHLYVQLWRLQEFAGMPLPLSKRCVYGVDGNAPESQLVIPIKSFSSDLRTVGNLDVPFLFSMNISDPGNFTVVAFATDGRARLDFTTVQPLGWLHGDSCLGGWGAICAVYFPLMMSSVKSNLSVPLRFSTTIQPGTWNRSAVTVRDGFTVALLRGNATERGYAHGRLLGAQVMDMVELFLVEDRVTSVALYEHTVRPAFRSDVLDVSKHVGFMAEAASLVRGVCDSVNCTLSWGRQLDAWDIVVLNGYGIWSTVVKADALPGWMQGGEQGRARACSQFVLWDSATSDGQTLHGRNMDGEIDVRKITVSDVVVFAVDPAEDGAARFASVMWPGFIGTYRFVDALLS